MPFKSKKQRAYLYANKPDVAEKFAKHTKKKDARPMPKRGQRKAHNKGKK